MNPAEIAPGLDQLRGLHLPGGAAGAVQGEVVAAAALGFLAALLVGLVRYLRGRARASLRRSALAELAGTRDLDPDARLVAQARLLRRLDTLLATDFFTRGSGRVLADGLYRRQTPGLDGLDAELGRLIGRLRA
jgi:hypothetical protein